MDDRNETPGNDAPVGELSTRTVAMPADTNPAGDIFGGWLLAQMDIAGGIVANRRAGGRTATVAVDAMKFHLPVFVGDVLCCYATHPAGRHQLDRRQDRGLGGAAEFRRACKGDRGSFHLCRLGR